MGVDPVSERRQYSNGGLAEEDLDTDPLLQLQAWLDHAATVDQGVEPSAMVLATVDADGRPATRTVLLRRVRNGRLYFFTSYTSRKGLHLAENNNVSLLFRWAWPARQVEVQGRAVRAPEEESDAYFATRPRGSQLGAHASPQSAPIAGREVLEERMVEMERAFADTEVPRPANWGGYVVTPRRFEFWEGRPDRLHDRFAYDWHDGRWKVTRLGP